MMMRVLTCFPLTQGPNLVHFDNWQSIGPVKDKRRCLTFKSNIIIQYELPIFVKSERKTYLDLWHNRLGKSHYCRSQPQFQSFHLLTLLCHLKQYNLILRIQEEDWSTFEFSPEFHLHKFLNILSTIAMSSKRH